MREKRKMEQGKARMRLRTIVSPDGTAYIQPGSYRFIFDKCAVPGNLSVDYGQVNHVVPKSHVFPVHRYLIDLWQGVVYQILQWVSPAEVDFATHLRPAVTVSGTTPCLTKSMTARAQRPLTSRQGVEDRSSGVLGESLQVIEFDIYIVCISRQKLIHLSENR
jgi:hypothetical protein